MSPAHTVRAQVALRLIRPGRPVVPVLATLRYDVRDPWAVAATFQECGRDGAEVSWLFGRQLLTDGLAGPVGAGDVAIRPVDGGVRLALRSPTGAALVEGDREEVVDFLQRTYLLVPTGHEAGCVDLDAELALLLSPGR